LFVYLQMKAERGVGLLCESEDSFPCVHNNFVMSLHKSAMLWNGDYKDDLSPAPLQFSLKGQCHEIFCFRFFRK
jgi:hypothetical protein